VAPFHFSLRLLLVAYSTTIPTSIAIATAVSATAIPLVTPPTVGHAYRAQHLPVFAQITPARSPARRRAC